MAFWGSPLHFASASGSIGNERRQVRAHSHRFNILIGRLQTELMARYGTFPYGFQFLIGRLQTDHPRL